MARRVTRKRALPGYKACRQCKAVIPDEEVKCPYCGSTDFTDEWRGLVIILNPEKSCIAKKLGINRQGMFALEVS